jgi:hypothetical protein
MPQWFGWNCLRWIIDGWFGRQAHWRRMIERLWSQRSNSSFIWKDDLSFYHWKSAKNRSDSSWLNAYTMSSIPWVLTMATNPRNTPKLTAKTSRINCMQEPPFDTYQIDLWGHFLMCFWWQISLNIWASSCEAHALSRPVHPVGRCPRQPVMNRLFSTPSGRLSVIKHDRCQQLRATCKCCDPMTQTSILVSGAVNASRLRVFWRSLMVWHL